RGDEEDRRSVPRADETRGGGDEGLFQELRRRGVWRGVQGSRKDGEGDRRAIGEDRRTRSERASVRGDVRACDP
ncbi:MAG: hypothetical protein EBW90_07425, partial [Rhodobacteraceae bacterium]|nr:hypothetical protein [Paracoccaceae bacterium]